MSSDDVVDYMVMEAVALKVHKEDEEQQKQRERDQWKQDQSNLDHLR
jgi:phage/plasmid-associated DNA primase